MDHLKHVENIRCAEENVMKVQTELQKNPVDQLIDLSSKYADKYTLLRLESLNNSDYCSVAQSKQSKSVQ